MPHQIYTAAATAARKMPTNAAKPATNNLLDGDSE